MLNHKLLKSFLVGSWLLVVYAATPIATDSTRWLAGFVLAASYALCGIVFGATDQEAIKVVKTLRDEMLAWQARVNSDMASSASKCDAATDRVSKAISELRRLDSQRFE